MEMFFKRIFIHIARYRSISAEEQYLAEVRTTERKSTTTAYIRAQWLDNGTFFHSLSVK